MSPGVDLSPLPTMKSNGMGQTMLVLAPFQTATEITMMVNFWTLAKQPFFGPQLKRVHHHGIECCNLILIGSCRIQTAISLMDIPSAASKTNLLPSCLTQQRFKAVVVTVSVSIEEGPSEFAS